VTARAGCRISAQVSGEIVPGRVDDADRDAEPGLLNRKSQVAVVGDHKRGVDLAAEDVQQEVRGDIASEPFSSRLA
jgi:hypothetical protein